MLVDGLSFARVDVVKPGLALALEKLLEASNWMPEPNDNAIMSHVFTTTPIHAQDEIIGHNHAERRRCVGQFEDAAYRLLSRTTKQVNHFRPPRPRGQYPAPW